MMSVFRNDLSSKTASKFKVTQQIVDIKAVSKELVFHETDRWKAEDEMVGRIAFLLMMLNHL